MQLSNSDQDPIEGGKAAGIPEPYPYPHISSACTHSQLTPVTDEKTLTPKDLGGPGGLISGYSEKRIRQCARWSVQFNDHKSCILSYRMLRSDSEKERHPCLSIVGPGPKDYWDLLEIVSYPPLGSLGRPYKDAEWRFRRLRQVLEVC